MERGKFCKYHTPAILSGKRVCKANIDVRKLVGGKDFEWLKRIPCNITFESDIECPMFTLKTKEEIKQDEKDWQTVLDRITKLDPLIAKLKKQYKENGGSGTEECPVCKGDLQWGIAACNGHIHMKCKTKDCVFVME